MKIIKTAIIVAVLLVMKTNAQISVIANKGVGEGQVSVSKVLNIYSLAITKWSDGSKITVFDNSSEAKTAFYAAIGKDVLSLKKEWLKKQLTGEAKAPESLSSDTDVIKKVASTPGAVGFIKSSGVSGDVKVLLEVK